MVFFLYLLSNFRGNKKDLHSGLKSFSFFYKKVGLDLFLIRVTRGNLYSHFCKCFVNRCSMRNYKKYPTSFKYVINWGNTINQIHCSSFFLSEVIHFTEIT